MPKRAAYVVAAAAVSMLVAFTAPTRTVAQGIENGVGVVCDSPAQVEQFIALRLDTKDAIEAINAQNKAVACQMIDAAFLVGGVVGEASNDKGTWQIRRILIVGLIVGRVTSPVQPYEKYTAFIISKASPI